MFVVLSLISILHFTLQSPDVEIHKRRVLDSLNLSARPPPFSRHPPLHPYRIARQRGLYGGTLEHMILEAYLNDWQCVTPDSIVDDCLHFVLDFTHHVVDASFVVHTKSLNHTNITIYEVDEYFGDLRRVDGFGISDTFDDSIRVHFDMSSELHEWMRRGETLKMLKIEILSADSNRSAIDALRRAPFFELTVFQPYPSESNDCSGCCVHPFYVNFTEIGWDDWILSPRGFYANYCHGVCIPDQHASNDFTSQIIQASVDKSLNITTTCAPNYYGSVEFIVALSPWDIRKTQVHGIRALSCACS